MSEEMLSGIFIAEYELNNMNMERIVVSNPAILEILKRVRLTPKAQEEAVFALVDRTLNWAELSTEEQVNKIKAVLTQETVVEYLRKENIIRDKVDVIEVGIDHEGSIVVYAYYTNLNREQRRRMKKQMNEEKIEQMKQVVNIMGSNDNIIDLAAKKIEKLKREGKSFRGRKLK